MLLRNLRTIQLLKPLKARFSNSKTEWMESPFIPRAEIPAYFQFCQRVMLQEKPIEETVLRADQKLVQSPSHVAVEQSPEVQMSEALNEPEVQQSLSKTKRRFGRKIRPLRQKLSKN